jgi:peptide/nickel transport system ATP-binding protein
MNDAPLSLDTFSIAIGARRLLEGIDFTPPRGSSTVIVGPTGAGKSVLLRAVAGLLPLGTFTLGGSMRLHGLPAYTRGRKSRHGTWARIMTRGLVFVPAESAQAMNPSLTLEHNRRLLAPEARGTIQERLKEYFGLDFGAFARLYPDEVSGGELQRITLMILLSRPGELVLLDEPTVNLDRALRRRFADFLNAEILRDRSKTVLMASHDLDFIHSLVIDDAYALEAARLVHLDGVPRANGFRKAPSRKPGGAGVILEDVAQSFFKRGIFGERTFQAFSGLSLQLDRSTIHGITGPSGCGKSSMIKAILRLIDGTTGSIRMDGQDLVALKRRERGGDPPAFIPFRRKMAVVQQDSRFAFFPDLRIRDSFRHIEAGRGGRGSIDRALLQKYLALVGLRDAHLNAFPRSLSSGEMKRMDIARALSAKPEVLLLDEPFAHIDFDTRAKVMGAISGYLSETAALLVVVTHEDFDLRYFIERNYDFPQLVGHEA